MLELNKLPKITGKKAKRVGRGLGSRKGAKSGRGTTRHQKAREDIPLHFEGGQNRMVKKFPLLRGKGRNKPSPFKPLTLRLDALNIFKSGEVVDRQKLVEMGVFKKEVLRRGAKIVNSGELKVKNLKLKGLYASKSALEVLRKNKISILE